MDTTKKYKVDEDSQIDIEVIDSDEFDAAEELAMTEAGFGIYQHIFQTPFTWEGKSYEHLTFRWDKLTGRDSLAIERELTRLGKTLIAAEFSGEYLARMAVRACEERIGLDVFLAMPLGDYTRIVSRARSFLLRSGS